MCVYNSTSLYASELQPFINMRTILYRPNSISIRLVKVDFLAIDYKSSWAFRAVAFVLVTGLSNSNEGLGKQLLFS